MNMEKDFDKVLNRAIVMILLIAQLICLGGILNVLTDILAKLSCPPLP